MTDEQQTVLLIKGAISDFPPEEKEKVEQAYSAIRAMEEKYGEIAVRFAVALRGAELAAED